MKPKHNIWIFIGQGAMFPAAAFQGFGDAKSWVAKHKLTGMISAMPIDQGLFEWAEENDAFNMSDEKLKIKALDSEFIATCTTASLEHYHFTNGLLNE